jgi:hypothetical protein
MDMTDLDSFVSGAEGGADGEDSAVPAAPDGRLVASAAGGLSPGFQNDMMRYVEP